MTIAENNLYPTKDEWFMIVKSLPEDDLTMCRIILDHIANHGLEYNSAKIMLPSFNYIKHTVETILNYRLDLERRLDDLYAENRSLRIQLQQLKNKGE